MVFHNGNFDLNFLAAIQKKGLVKGVGVVHMAWDPKQPEMKWLLLKR